MASDEENRHAHRTGVLRVGSIVRHPAAAEGRKGAQQQQQQEEEHHSAASLGAHGGFALARHLERVREKVRAISFRGAAVAAPEKK